MLILYFFLGTMTATVFALLEIQIEGKNGWAGQLPTWKFYKPWFRFIPGGNKPLTGYHTYLWLFIFIYPHVCFLFLPWSLGVEIFLLSFVFFVLRLEDFLWHVFNPHFGLKKFKKEFVTWHTQWLWGLPIQYYSSIALWLVLFIVGYSLIH